MSIARTLSRSSVGPTARYLSTVLIYIVVFWVALPVFLLATGFRLDRLWPADLLDSGVTDLAAGMLIVAGTALMFASMAQLGVKGRGLPISHLPPTRLVVNGPHRLLRHPIYVGYSAAFGGLALLLDSFWSFFFSMPLLTLGWMAYALYLEEPILIERFGSVYLDYRRRTRLLVPVPKGIGHAASDRKRTDWFWNGVNRLANKTILIRRGNFIVVTYGLFCALGSVFTASWLTVVLVGQGLPPAHVGWLLVGSALSTSGLAWVFWWLGNCRRLIHERWWGLGQIGFISYGGLVGVLAFPILFAIRLGYPPLMLTDAIILSLFWTYAFGRIGCLSYGCCYGRPTENRHGVTYENPDAKMIRKGDHRHVARYPTQLYSFAHAVLLIVVLNAMTWAPIPTGLITAMGLMLVGLGRTFTESYRDREQPLFGRFTYGHLGSWITFLAGWLLLFVVKPGADASTPSHVTLDLFAQSAGLWPFVLVVGILILAIFGIHWKRVGCWFG